MRWSWWFSMASVLVGLALVASPLSAQSDPKADMQAMMEAMQPGAQHEAMGFFIGDWTTTSKMWMGPGEPTVSEGTASYEWLMGGRYLKATFQGDTMGMPMQGMSIDGYDKIRGEYFSLWIDNMGTGYMASVGTSTDGGKTITYSGTTADPVSGVDVKHRSVSTQTGESTFTFEMFMMLPDGGGEMKVMEVTFTRDMGE